MSRDGIIYGATGDRYIAEVLASAERAHVVMPTLPITLFADQPVESPVFDQVIVLPEFRREYGDKILGMQRSPYTRTLFLDTDIYVVANLTSIFEMLDQFDLAAAHSRFRREGIRFAEWWNRVPEAFVQMNSGVIALKRSPVTDEFLADWWRLNEQFKAAYPSEPPIDQPSFREALYRSRARLAVLSPEYNLRVQSFAYATGQVKVLHGRYPKMAQYARKINLHQGPRVVRVFGSYLLILNNEALWKTINRNIRRDWKASKRNASWQWKNVKKFARRARRRRLSNIP